MHARLLSEDVSYCAHCGTPIHGKPDHCICRDGLYDGPKVPLCKRCGGPKVSAKAIWDRISRHAKHNPDRSLN